MGRRLSSGEWWLIIALNHLMTDAEWNRHYENEASYPRGGSPRRRQWVRLSKNSSHLRYQPFSTEFKKQWMSFTVWNQLWSVKQDAWDNREIALRYDTIWFPQLGHNISTIMTKSRPYSFKITERWFPWLDESSFFWHCENLNKQPAECFFVSGPVNIFLLIQPIC